MWELVRVAEYRPEARNPQTVTFPFGMIQHGRVAVRGSLYIQTARIICPFLMISPFPPTAGLSSRISLFAIAEVGAEV